MKIKVTGSSTYERELDGLVMESRVYSPPPSDAPEGEVWNGVLGRFIKEEDARYPFEVDEEKTIFGDDHLAEWGVKEELAEGLEGEDGEDADMEEAQEEGLEQGEKRYRESALDAAIEYLQNPANDDVKPNVFSNKWAVKKETEAGKVKGKKASKTAQDSLYEALVADESPKGKTLAEHDKERHPDGFNPETDTCKFREEMKKETEEDRADEISSETAPKAEGGEGGGQKKPLVSLEEDKEYMEAVERGDLSTARKLLYDVAIRSGFFDKKLYHGTQRIDEGYDDFGKVYRNRAFNVFNTKHQNSESPKNVFWVTPSESIAQTYSRNHPYSNSRGMVIPLYVKMSNPYVYDAENSEWDGLPNGKTINDLAEEAKENGYDSIIIKNVRDVGEGGYYYDDDGVQRISLSDGRDGRDAYDTSIAIFSPSQIKSANVIEKDDNGNVVPLSRRFDDGDDIRGDVSGSTSSGSGGEEFGESFYAEVYHDRRQSYSAEFGTDEAEETAEAEAAYKANFTRDGQYKMPFEGGKFSRRILDDAQKPKKAQKSNSGTITLPSGRKIPAAQKYLHTDTKGNLHDEMWSVFLEKHTGDGSVSQEFSDVVEGLFSGRDFDADAIKALPEWKRAMEREQEIQRDLQETHGVSSTIDINTEDREQFREAIIKAAMSDHISKTVPIEGTDREFETNEGLGNGESYDVEKGRNICIVIGLPAAGKSTSFANPLAKKFKARLCDSDTIKKVLPEFNNGYGGNLVHEESTKLNEEILGRSIEQGDNIVYPILGYKPDKLEKLFERLRGKGYKINLCLKDMPANVAKGRLLGRFLSKGRYLPIECITKAQGKFADCFERVKGLVDAYVRATSDIDGSNERIIEQKGDLI